MMDLQQLKYFQTVAKLEHMTKAAIILNVSQPALSKAISQLEGEIGTPLFERVGRSIRLNRYGRIFLEKTLSITEIFEEAKKEIEDLIMPDSGKVSIGFTHSIGTQILSRMIKKYHQIYPDVRFEVAQRNSLNLLEDLAAGNCDICIVPQIETNIAIQWQKLWKEEVYVIVPNEHPLAKLDYIKLKDIGNEPIVAIKEGNSLRQLQTNFFKKVGIDPVIVFEGEEFHTVASFVEAGFGVALLPNIQKLQGYNIKKLRVTDILCERTIGIAKMNMRYIPDVSKKFEEFLVEQLTDFN